ncbi:MAG TPA: UvrD-helicase domain-containing protein [Myxococcaceae bacterium]|nr:UvrD-helicase domain-containing protein [Myxococcaceae bacterium]
MAHPLALEQNLVLSAGAGAGKTWSLVTLAIHVLVGAREGTPVRPAELVMLTFTEKAATEMRRRLRERLDALAANPELPPEEEVIRGSFERLGRPLPTAAEWGLLRDAVGAANVGTFHALCVQLLRRAPAGSGIDPEFELLEPREADALVTACAEDVVLEALEAREEGLAELVTELNFESRGRAQGVVQVLVDLLTRTREEGLEPATVAISEPAVLEEGFASAHRGLLRLLNELGTDDRAPEIWPICRELLDLLAPVGVQDFGAPDFRARVAAVMERAKAIADAGKGTRRPKGRRAPSTPVNEIRKALLDPKQPESLVCRAAAWRSAPHEVLLRELLTRLDRRYRAALVRRGALDFTGLLVLARDLLRDHPGARRQAQAACGVLLVDEFQDTNRLQLELVTLLAERREGGPRRLAPGADVLSLPLEPAHLCIVGDRKQSIYEFRGADVSVFGIAEKKLVEEGGRREDLQTNRRSSPELLTTFNTVFAEVMAPSPDPRDYEVDFREGDRLLAHRGPLVGRPAVERWQTDWSEKSAEIREQDAQVIARRLATLLGPEGPACVADGAGGLRQAQGRDIAILFRAFTSIELYRQALLLAGVPHRIVRGRGFYGAQEVLDLASFLSLLADPRDGISLAAVLRSPMVGLTDASLLAVTAATGTRLTLKGLQPGVLDTLSLPAWERENLDRLRSLLSELRPALPRLGLAEILEVVVRTTDLRVRLAATPYAEQSLSNLDKLMELAASRDAGGHRDVGAFARELLELAETEPTEAQAETLDADDPRAVVLMTIHQSKGLEWPIVVVPDLGTKVLRGGSGPVRYDRREGLALRPQDPLVPGGLTSERWERFKDEATRRELAETRRLLYVALTRARDLLALSGAVAKRSGSQNWLTWLQSPLEQLGALVEQVDIDRTAPLPAPEGRAAVDEALAPAWQEALGRLEAPIPLRPRELVIPVTHLADFARCPRCYRDARLLGLAMPSAWQGRGGPKPVTPSGDADPELSDARVRGSLAHRLLETVPLASWGADASGRQQTLTAAAFREGLMSAGPEARSVLERVEGFLGTDFARKLGQAPPEWVRRELPFLLKLDLGGPDDLRVFIKGTMDLLVEEEGGWLSVVDYKSGRPGPEGVGPHRFQLSAYALAAWELSHRRARVRRGVVFLGEAHPEPRWDSAPWSPDAAIAELTSTARQLLGAARDGVFPPGVAGSCPAGHGAAVPRDALRAGP